MNSEPLTLYQLNNLTRRCIEQGMSGEYWLAAELSAADLRSNGHCYLEFVQKSELPGSGQGLVAKARGTIWRSTYMRLAPAFVAATGKPLCAGMKVLVRVKVTFHEQFGHSLNVVGIDPSYTLGYYARQRRETVERLQREGLYNLNKGLTLPRPLWRIAIVSAETAAGYDDFLNQLAASPYRFRVRLFAATMQGELAEASVIDALGRIAEEADCWDAVALIRGGGATSDLACFDQYLLCAHIAQFPLPVLCGIGHERDITVADEVAHTRCKTPTAVAAFLVDQQRMEWETIQNLQTRITLAASDNLLARQQNFERLALRLQNAASHYASRQRETLLGLMARLQTATLRHQQRESLRLQTMEPRLYNRVTELIIAQRHKIDLIYTRLQAVSPERILRMGYSITRLGGKTVRSTIQLRPGDRLITLLAEGEVHSIVADTPLPSSRAEKD